MIIYNDGTFLINPNCPDSMFDSEAQYVLPDGSDLAIKYLSLFSQDKNPQFILNENNEIVDINEDDSIIREREIRYQINALKQKLSDSDYKIIKCYEASLEHKDIMPYDVDVLIAERDAIRQQINDLEATL